MATLATDPALASTMRYLRFALPADHRAPLQDGSACPHCQGRRVQKWGQFSGRQRYRCRDCARTFSTFTGTALHYLKKPERWRRFLWCVDGRLTVRSSAAALGVNKDTALRWRHRLLEQWRREPRPRLTGRVVIGDFSMPHSAKGERSLSLSLRRPARRHGEPWISLSARIDLVTVLVAWQSPTAMIIGSAKVGSRTTGLRPPDYEAQLGLQLRDVTEITGCRGRAFGLAGFARRMGVPYRPRIRSFLPVEIIEVRRRLRTWLRPFHGVATRRLDNYLEWFRRREACCWPHPPSLPPTTQPPWRPWRPPNNSRGQRTRGARRREGGCRDPGRQS